MTVTTRLIEATPQFIIIGQSLYVCFLYTGNVFLIFNFDFTYGVVNETDSA